MGYPMAENIRRRMHANSTLFVYDISQAACQRFTSELGHLGTIIVTKSPKEAAENAKVVISIVPDASDVRKVYLDNQYGVIAAKADSQRLLLECSTIDSQSAVEVGQRIRSANRGIYIDTPVSVRNGLAEIHLSMLRSRGRGSGCQSWHSFVPYWTYRSQRT